MGRLSNAAAPHGRVLVIGAYPTQRAAIAELLPMFEIDEASSLRAAAQRRGSREYAGMIVLVQSVSDLAAAARGRARMGAPSTLVVAPRADEAIVNRAQLLDAQCAVGVGVARNVRAFAERLLARRRGPRLPAETLAERYAEGHALTDRKRQLLGHIAAGVRRRELASAMGVKESTIKTQVRWLLRRLGAPSVDALAVAMLRGAPLKRGTRMRRA